MRILTLVASGQPEANLESARYFFENNSRIEKIAIFASVYMTQTGAATGLKQIIEPLYHGAIEIIDVPNGIEEENLQELEQLILAWMKQQPAFSTYLFNVTGGTKLFSLAFDHVSTIVGKNRAECFYQNRKQNIVWYQRQTGKTLYQMNTNLNLQQRVSARGYEINSQQLITELPVQDLNYANFLISQLRLDFQTGRRLCSLMHKLAGLGETKQGYLIDVDISTVDQFSRDVMQQLALDTEQRYFTFDADHQLIRFQDKASCNYVKGGWLEVYVGFECFKALIGYNPQAELAINVELKKQGTPNEMDVMFIYDAFLFCIECKAAKTMADNSAKDVLYKLTALNDLGGIKQKRAVVSLYPLREHNLLRAQNADIKIFQEKELLNLQHHIDQWLQTQQAINSSN